MLSVVPAAEIKLQAAREISNAIDEWLSYHGKQPRFRRELEDCLNHLRLFYCQHSDSDIDESRAVTKLTPDWKGDCTYFDFVCQDHDGNVIVNGGLKLCLPKFDNLHPVAVTCALETGKHEILHYHGWSTHT